MSELLEERKARTVDWFFARSIPEPNSGCWLWLLACRDNGYGAVRIDRRTLGAHRACYEAKHGAVSSDLDICHKCDVRSCVNPDHMFVGSRADNMADCAAKGRAKNPPVLSGSSSPNSRLSPDQVRAIRVDPRSNRAIARQLGVNKKTVALIRARVTWRDM